MCSRFRSSSFRSGIGLKPWLSGYEAVIATGAAACALSRPMREKPSWNGSAVDRGVVDLESGSRVVPDERQVADRA